MTESLFSVVSKRMSDDKKAKALSRKNRELEIIVNNGYSCEYLLLKIILEHSCSQMRLMTFGGQISYSYVAYLLGITTIDPLERDYNLEMLLDYHHDRNPYMLVFGSSKYKEMLVAYLSRLFGEDMVEHDDLGIVIGRKLDSIDCLRIGYIENPLIEKTEKAIYSKCLDYNRMFTACRKSALPPNYFTGPIPSEQTKNVLKLLKWIIDIEKQPESVKKLFGSLYDETYEGLLRILAAIHGIGIAESGLQDSQHNRILTRDDLYRMGLSLFGYEKDAYDYMHKIRRGRGKDPRYQAVLEKAGVSAEVREKLKHIQYVVSEGSLITEAQLILFLAAQNA